MKRLAIAFAAILAFGAGALTDAIYGSPTSIPVADWLAFSGALLGAAITVLGGIFLLEWQRSSEARLRKSLLVEALTETINLTHGFYSADEPALKKSTGLTVGELSEKIQRSIERLHEIRAWMTPDSVAMLRAFDDIKKLTAYNDDVSEGIRWKHIKGADLGGLNATGHSIAAKAQSAINHLKSR